MSRSYMYRYGAAGLCLLGAGLLVFLSIAVLSGCTSDYEFTTLDGYDECSYSCTPEITSEWLNTAAENENAGYSSEIVLFYSAGYAGEQCQLFTGAPLADDNNGKVYIFDASRETGMMTSTSPSAELEIPLPPRARRGEIRFGHALQRADLIAGVDEFFPAEEIVIGAPGTGTRSYAGQIFWAEMGSDHPWTIGGHWAPKLPEGAQFGYAIALSSYQPAWLAVGAPGFDNVFIVGIDYDNTENPFQVLERIPAPHIARDGMFGASLAIGDFDGDGVDDLAIGAPKARDSGKVFVYRNSTNDADWDAATNGPFRYLPPYSPAVVGPLEITGIDSSPAQDYGLSLSAGNFWGQFSDRQALLIGVPGYSERTITASGERSTRLRTGAVVQAVFEAIDRDGDGNLDVETVVPDVGDGSIGYKALTNPTLLSEQQFGYRVATGRFGYSDNDGAAITSIGFHDFGGKVEVFCSGNDGLSLSSNLVTLTGRASAGSYFGASLGTAQVQSYVSNYYEDLFIGASRADGGKGAVFLTKASGTDGVSGMWYGYDANDAYGEGYYSQEFRAITLYDEESEEIRLILLDDVNLVVTDDDGNICSVTIAGKTYEFAATIPANTATDPVSFPRGSTEVEFEYSVRGFSVPVTLHLTETELELDIEPPALLAGALEGCTLQPSPLVLRKLSDCE